MYKLYSTRANYTKKLNEINLKMGFPSKKYSKILAGKRKHFIAKKIMTRTWANENPQITKQGKYAFPVPKEMEKDFTGLVEYNNNWYESEITKL